MFTHFKIVLLFLSVFFVKLGSKSQCTTRMKCRTRDGQDPVLPTHDGFW